MVPCYAESLPKVCFFKPKNGKLRKSESVRGYGGAIEYPVCSKAKHSKVDHQHLIVFNAAYQFLHWAVAPARVFERNKYTESPGVNVDTQVQGQEIYVCWNIGQRPSYMRMNISQTTRDFYT